LCRYAEHKAQQRARLEIIEQQERAVVGGCTS
jgi:hypothetical protein